MLRACRAKLWADGASDAERLDDFKGFVLVAHLKVLFDRGLISFGTDGNCLISQVLGDDAAADLGVTSKSLLHWIAKNHQA